MRVLLVEREGHAGSDRARELARRHEVRVAGSLAEALLDLTGEEERPDLVVTDLDLPDAQGGEALLALQEAAWDVPILVVDPHRPLTRAASALEVLELERVEFAADDDGELAVRRHAARSLALVRAEDEVALERLALRVADETARRTAEEFGRRLGLEAADGEDLRRAIRLARGVDHFRSRFVGALATGLGAALLVALANGIALLLRRHAGDP